MEARLKMYCTQPRTAIKYLLPDIEHKAGKMPALQNDSPEEKFTKRIFLPRYHPLQQPRIQPSTPGMPGSLLVCNQKKFGQIWLQTLCIVHHVKPRPLPDRTSHSRRFA